MQLSFEYRNVTIGEWRDYLAKVQKSNWMQSWPYAKAQSTRDFKKLKFVVIKQAEREIGFFAMTDIKLGPIHFVEIQRGPLWMTELNSEILSLFCEKLRNEFPNKLLSRFRWLPELENNESWLSIIEKSGFKKRKPNYSTVWIDLSLDSLTLEKNLDGKWRNSLKKAQGSDLKIFIDKSKNKLNEFLSYYLKHKSEKSYLGPSAEFIKVEYLTALPTQDRFLIWAYKEDIPVAGILIAIHGNSASYRIGWNSTEGRKCNAHYLLIWEALELLKAQRISYLDLGGTLPKEAPGLTLFKTRTGGEFIENIGLFS